MSEEYLDVSEKFQGRALCFEHKGKYYVASSVVLPMGLGEETLIFNSDKEGNVEDFSEQGGRRSLDTESVIEDFKNGNL